MTKYYVGIGKHYGLTTFKTDDEHEAINYLIAHGAKNVETYYEYGSVEIEFDSDENTDLDAISSVFEMYESFVITDE